MVLGGVATFFLLLTPKLFSQMGIHLFIEIFVFALFAVSFNLLFGYGGMLPFGHGALFGVGAYVTALIFNHLPEYPLLLVLLVGALSGFLTGALIGFICARLSGVYLSLTSLAFQMFFFAVVLKWRSLTHGDDGMSVIRPELHLPVLGSLPMVDVHNLYYFTLVIVALGIFACYFFLKTSFGNSVLCIRENDIRASCLGYNVFLTKLAVFSLSGFLAGLAGGLFALFQGFVATSCINLDMSINCLIMVVLGGTKYFFGPVLGTGFYFVFQNWLSSLTPNWPLFIGLFFVVIVLCLEGGIASLVYKLGKMRI